MKKTFLFTFTILVSLALNAQNAEEIFRNSLAKNGGEAFEKLNAIQTIGTLETPMGDLEITMYQLHNKGFKQEFEIMGKKNYMLTTPEASYQMMAIQGIKEPKKIDDKMHRILKDQLNLRGYFEKRDGLEFIAEGTKEIEGLHAYRIWVVDSKKLIKILYITVDELQKIREDILIEPVNFGEHEMYRDVEQEDIKRNLISMQYTNYEKTDLGIMMPKIIKSNMGTITVKTLKINPNITEKDFDISKQGN